MLGPVPHAPERSVQERRCTKTTDCRRRHPTRRRFRNSSTTPTQHPSPALYPALLQRTCRKHAACRWVWWPSRWPVTAPAAPPLPAGPRTSPAVPAVSPTSTRYVTWTITAGHARYVAVATILARPAAFGGALCWGGQGGSGAEGRVESEWRLHRLMSGAAPSACLCLLCLTPRLVYLLPLPLHHPAGTMTPGRAVALRCRSCGPGRWTACAL